MTADRGIRAFLAVNPGSHFCRELSLRLDPVLKECGNIEALRWTRPESWHLTLQFLGTWPESALERLQESLRGVSLPRTFTMKSGALGAFPTLDRPRVFFLHLESDGQAEALARRVRQQVQEVWPEGPQDTRPFRAHLTLARIKGRLEARQWAPLTACDLEELPPIAVQDFTLVASQLKAQGAEHRILARYGLDGVFEGD